MKFSVVIPCHNAAPFIAATLRSVAAQTLRPHEIIVVDDASTDDSVRQIQASGVPVTLLSVAHRNAAATRNDGIAAATGDWIAFQDSQDLWYPRHLELAAEMLSAGPAIAYDATTDDLSGEGRITPRAPIPPRTDHPLHAIPGEAYIETGIGFSQQTLVVSRQRLREIGGYDPALRRRHDIDLWLRAIAGHYFAYRPQATAAWRTDVSAGLSQNALSANEFLLRALRKNEQAHASDAYRRWRAKVAHDTMSLAFTHAPSAQARREALALAWPDLAPAHQRLARLLSLQPQLARYAIRAYRAARRGRASGGTAA